MKDIEFSLLKSVFVNALEFANKSLPSKSTSPILKTFLISATEQGISFRTKSRNSQSYLMLKGAEAKKQGEICVDYIILSAISLFDDGEIKFSFSKNKLVVSQGKRRHTIAHFDPEKEKFPEKIEVDNYREYDPTKLFEVLNRLSLTVGTGTKQPFDQSFYLDTHRQFIMSGNGVAVSYYGDFEFPYLKKEEDSIIPFPMALPYGNMLISNLSSFSRSEGDKFYISLGSMNAFKIESENLEREFIFSSFAGEYSQKGIKAVDRALGDSPTLQIKVAKEALLKSLSMCKLYSDRALDEGKTNSTMIMISNAEGTPQVQFKMSVKGIADEVIEPINGELSFTDETFVFKFHPGSLLEAVKLIVSPSVELRFFESQRPFIMLDAGVPSYVYLQTPMLLPSEVKKKEVPQDVAAVTP